MLQEVFFSILFLETDWDFPNKKSLLFKRLSAVSDSHQRTRKLHHHLPKQKSLLFKRLSAVSDIHRRTQKTLTILPKQKASFSSDFLRSPIFIGGLENCHHFAKNKKPPFQGDFCGLDIHRRTQKLTVLPKTKASFSRDFCGLRYSSEDSKNLPFCQNKSLLFRDFLRSPIFIGGLEKLTILPKQKVSFQVTFCGLDIHRRTQKALPFCLKQKSLLFKRLSAVSDIHRRTRKDLPFCPKKKPPFQVTFAVSIFIGGLENLPFYQNKKASFSKETFCGLRYSSEDSKTLTILPKTKKSPYQDFLRSRYSSEFSKAYHFYPKTKKSPFQELSARTGRDSRPTTSAVTEGGILTN